MPSPFPGMNPYLESPPVWSSFHTRLLVAIADTLAPMLRPNYYIEVETCTYREENSEDEEDELLVGIPDAAVLSATVSRQMQDNELEAAATPDQKRPHPIALPMPLTLKERYLEIREMGTETVITVIEVLSPKNKKRGRGRAAYVRAASPQENRKRSRILGSFSNLVEIDLLRANPPMTMLGQVQPTHYRIVVSRSEQRPQADLYGFNLSEPIPSFPLPLKPEEPEPIVDLQTIITGVCERAGYNERLDYQQPIPSPALPQTDQQWLDTLLDPLRSRSPEDKS